MLNSNRPMMRAGSWRCLTMATGEIPVVGSSTQQGADFYAGHFSSVCNVVLACGYPQADNVALLALMDALAQFYVFALRVAFAATEIGRGAARLEHDAAT